MQAADSTTDVFVAEVFQFQFNKHRAFEDTMIENQIDEVMCVADKDALLPSLETEAVAQLQQEILQFVEQLVFQIRFAHHLFGP